MNQASSGQLGRRTVAVGKRVVPETKRWTNRWRRWSSAMIHMLQVGSGVVVATVDNLNPTWREFIKVVAISALMVIVYLAMTAW